MNTLSYDTRQDEKKEIRHNMYMEIMRLEIARIQKERKRVLEETHPAVPVPPLKEKPPPREEPLIWNSAISNAIRVIGNLDRPLSVKKAQEALEALKIYRGNKDGANR